MGTVVAQDIFQSKLDAIFIGMEGVTGIADDMVITGRDEMEHNRNFLELMEKCIFLWPLLVEAWDFTRSKEDTGTETYGVPTRQGNHEIFPSYNQLP